MEEFSKEDLRFVTLFLRKYQDNPINRESELRKEFPIFAKLMDDIVKEWEMMPLYPTAHSIITFTITAGRKKYTKTDKIKIAKEFVFQLISPDSHNTIYYQFRWLPSKGFIEIENVIKLISGDIKKRYGII